MIEPDALAAEDIYCKYLDAFKHLWGMPNPVARKLGVLGNELFEAEFAVHGPAAYNTSVIMPIRNAAFNRHFILRRHDRFLGHEYLQPPILDYGCGVGFQLLWLKAMGYKPEDLWGYDLPGPQTKVREHVFAAEGINNGIPPNPGSILCFHVLEHLVDPWPTLAYLRSLGGLLYASCVDEPGHGHLIGSEQAAAVVADLKKQGNYVNDYWRPGTE